jgi:hypothetical protein
MVILKNLEEISKIPTTLFKKKGALWQIIYFGEDGFYFWGGFKNISNFILGNNIVLHSEDESWKSEDISLTIMAKLLENNNWDQ